MKTDKIVNFGEVLKKAWHHVWKFKYLWLLGILAGGGTSMSSNNISSLSNLNTRSKDWQNFNTDSLTSFATSAGKVLGAANTSFPIILTIIIVLAVILLLLIFIYLNITARGAIISAVDGIDKDRNISLSQSWHMGHKYFWKILLFAILVCLLLLIPLLFLATPVVIMAMVRWYIPAIVVGLLFLLLFMVYAFYITLSMQYGERILVLENKQAWDSIKLGVNFFNKNWKNVLLAYLILIALMIGAGLVLAIGLFIIGGTFFGVVFGLYFANHNAAIIVAIPLGLALFAALLVASGLISSYQSTLLTLVYKEIKSNN